MFECVVDDAAEIWVDGRLPVALGQSSGQVAAGFNAPNRIVLTRDARPGQRFQLAVFGINGPISASPANYIWIRSATLDVYRPQHAAVTEQVDLRVERLDPRLDALLPEGALWTDLQDLLRRSKPDFDPTSAEARSAWEAAAVTPA